MYYLAARYDARTRASPRELRVATLSCNLYQAHRAVTPIRYCVSLSSVYRCILRNLWWYHYVFRDGESANPFTRINGEPTETTPIRGVTAPDMRTSRNM